MKLLLLWVLVLSGWAAIAGLRLSAFNIKQFGLPRARKVKPMNTLARIIARYDISLIQEVNNEAALDSLIDRVQNKHGITLSKLVSPKYGPEMYAYLYRKDKGISVGNTQIKDCGWKNKFRRPPYITQFQDRDGVVGSVTLVGLHTCPSKTVGELQALEQVWDGVKQQWKTNDIIVMGDLNAGGNYVKTSTWRNIALHNQQSYLWPIGDHTSTMVDWSVRPTSSERAYDRFILQRNSDIARAMIPGSVAVYNFTERLGLSLEESKEVSDHFPIEMELASILPSSKRPRPGV